MGSHSCRFLCYFSLSHALSLYSSHPLLRPVCPSPSAALFLQSAVSLLCETPDLLPQFSAKLVFEINLISSVYPLSHSYPSPSFLDLHICSFCQQLFPKDFLFRFACFFIYTHTHTYNTMYSLDIEDGAFVCPFPRKQMNALLGKASIFLHWTTPTRWSISLFIIPFSFSWAKF